MNDLQLYINDELVDLTDDSPIALTFQINNLAEVKNQQGNTSNQFKLPLTQNNRRILGFPDDVAFCDDKPYQQYRAKLVQDGLEIVPYGVCELNSVDQDMANVTILSGNVDFFDAIDGKLYEMGDSTSIWHSPLWKAYDHDWNIASVALSQSKTDGWIYPLIEYGNFLDDLDKDIDVRNMRPGFFIKSAIDLLVKSTGYKAAGSLLKDPLYPLLIAQFSNGNWEHGTDYQNQVNQNGVRLAQSQKELSRPTGYFRWNNVIQDDGHQMAPANDVFIANQSSDVKIVVTVPKLYMRGHISGDDQLAHVVFSVLYRDPNYPAVADKAIAAFDFTPANYGEDKGDKPDSFPGGWRRLNSSSGGKLYAELDILKTTMSVETPLPKGAGIFLAYKWFGRDSGSEPAYGRIDSATMEITQKLQNVQFEQTVQCERIFPDISQKDLLKDTLQRFGIICQTDNACRTVSFNSFKDVVNNIAKAKNWSGKCLDQGKSISYQLGGYAQANTMKYKADDAVTPVGFADSVINITDKTLPATTDLFESQFAPTLNRAYSNSNVAQIAMVDAEDEDKSFSISVSPRILIDQKVALSALSKSSLTFTDGTRQFTINDKVSMPYFYKTDAPDLTPEYGPGSLKFEDLRKKYYPELEKILKQTKKVVRYFLLAPRDILELDLLIPIYLEQDSAYYYINKIDSWRKGQPTKVELVKLG